MQKLSDGEPSPEQYQTRDLAKAHSQDTRVPTLPTLPDLVVHCLKSMQLVAFSCVPTPRYGLAAFVDSLAGRLLQP